MPSTDCRLTASDVADSDAAPITPERRESLMRAVRRHAQSVFIHAGAAGFDHPDSAEEPSDDVPFGRDFEDDGLDTTPTL